MPESPDRPRRHRLWRSPRLHRDHPDIENHETWLELFYDLVYVAVLIQLGNVLSDDVSWGGAGRYLVLFAPIWWAWSNFAFYMNRYVVDDALHRFIVAAQIFFVAWIGSSVGGAFGAQSTQFVLLYVGFRVTVILLYARTLGAVPATRALATRYITDYHLVAIALWSASLLLPPEQRWTLWLVAFAWELVNARRSPFRSLHREFPLNGEHMRQRFGTLTLLVLGESFIKAITLERTLDLTSAAALFSAPGIFVLFSLWWLYFEDTDDGYGSSEERRANPTLWLYTHLPLSAALVGFGVAAVKLFEAVYDGALDPNYALLYCASLIVFCLALVVLNLWSERPGRGERAVARAGAALVLALAFPLLAGRSALSFVGVAFALFALQIAHDLWLARRYPEATDEPAELMA